MQKEQIEILGVKIDTLKYKESLDFIVNRILEKKKTFVITPNPEILLLANTNAEYKKILNNSDLNTADGIGLIFASKYLKLRKKVNKVIEERVSGSDMMISIINDKRLYNKKIFLLGSTDEIAKKTAETLKKLSNEIQIVGTYSGRADESDDLISRKLINESKAEMIFVAFGAPKQENWIIRNREFLPEVLLFIGIGGSFDFISGAKKRAPSIMQKLGLEWLYRLYIEPKRIKRIFNAVFVFSYQVVKKDLFN